MKLKNVIKQDLLIGAATCGAYAIGVINFPVSIGIVVTLGVGQTIKWIYSK